MKEQRIAVEIDHEGRITAEADGFSGDACLRELEKLLDGLAEWENVTRKTDAQEPRVTHRRTTDLNTGRQP